MFIFAEQRHTAPPCTIRFYTTWTINPNTISIIKKVFFVICLALAGISAANAQEGQMAAGINLGVAPCLEGDGAPTNFGIGAKFQYNVTEPIRVEADLEYWFKAKGISVFDISANVHYLFNITDKLKVYPLAGIGYANLHSSAPKIEVSIPNIPNIPGMPDMSEYLKEIENAADASSNASRFLFNIGVGADYDITDNLVANFEIKYQYLKDFNRIPISIGIAYKF